MTWPEQTPGLLRLPSGRAVRGRALPAPSPDGSTPDFSVFLLGHEPPDTPWRSCWIRWRDFWLPADRADFTAVLQDVVVRCAQERIEFVCTGGRGRTGTALACLAILDGVDPDAAVGYVRAHYSSGAVETPWQRRFVRRFR